jgi:steroid delta-isomerase-like uncharacterized protein
VSHSESEKAIVRRFVDEVWNQGNVAAADEILAPTYVEHGPEPSAREMKEGPEAIKDFVQLFKSAFPDMVFTIDDMVAEGDKVAVRLRGVGTHQGRLGDLAPTGRRVTVSGAAIHRISDGRIAETFAYVDRMGLRQQLGAPNLELAK